MNGDGLVDYTFEGHLSFVIEDGVITSIVLNDYTGPRDNTVSAAAPVIADIDDADLAIAATKGDEVTMSITVNDADRDYGTLSYQWYKVEDKVDGTTGDTQNDTAVGTNSPSLTVTAANGRSVLLRGYQLRQWQGHHRRGSYLQELRRLHH